MPKFYDIAQGDDAWFNMRLGIPTTSDFPKIITPVGGDISKSADDYANLKVAEIMTGQMQGIIEPTKEMERGTMLEMEAREAYEFREGVTVERGGFITSNDGFVGCSPDFVVRGGGSLKLGEIKCLQAKNHIGFVINDTIDPKHKPQTQGQLWVSEAESTDYWLYHPDLPPHKIQIFRDESYIKNLAAAMESFRDLMSEKIVNLQRRGLWQVPAKPAPEKNNNPNGYTAADYLSAG